MRRPRVHLDALSARRCASRDIVADLARRRRLTRSLEDGYTLVELAITVVIMGVVLAMTGPIVAMFYNQSDNVQQTYAATNQVILASETLTQYLHDAVMPCPPGSGTCTTTQPYYSNLTSAACNGAFGATVQPCSTLLTIYANTGNQNGPAQVVFSVAQQSCPPPGPSSCPTLSATVTQPNAGTCPITGNPTGQCTYSAANARLLARVYDLTTTPASCSSSPTTCTISYLFNKGASCNSAVANPTPSQYANGITAVCLNLQNKLTGGEPVGYETLAYPLVSPSTFNGSVG